MSGNYGKTVQSLAPNSTPGGSMDDLGDTTTDHHKLGKQELANTRMNGYITNMYAGPGSHKGPAKIKGKSEHIKQEDEVGSDYGV
jgi:hypothetical protein